MDDEALSKAAVIINPRSGRGRGKGLALADALNSKPNPSIRVSILNTFEELAPILEHCAAEQVGNLFISSGDGTVQAVQSWIAEAGLFARPPRLCLMPHGTTNMTAADLGFRRTSIADQAAFISNPQPKSIRQRHTLRIRNPVGKGPLHGMFLGTGAISEATLYCQRVFNDNGLGGNIGPFATLAGALGKSLFSRANPHDPNRFDRPYDLRLTANDETLCDGKQLLLLATTLEKLILGAKPFWGGATASMRVTVLPYPLPNIPRWLLPVLYGSEQRAAPLGSVSKALQAFSVASATSFVLDGEFFEGPKDQPLEVETGTLFDYITS